VPYDAAGFFVPELVLQQPFGFPDQIIYLRENLVCELWVIAYRGVQRGYPAHRRVHRSEEFVRDARGHFRAVSPGEAVFMRDHHAIGLLYRSADGLTILWR